MYKQCIENEVELVLIDDQYSAEYKKALYKMQSQDDYSNLIHVFNGCKELFNNRLYFLKETLDYMKNHNVQMNGPSM